jgi:hypothetical protein
VRTTATSLDFWVDLPADLAPATLPVSAALLVMFPLACHFREDVDLEDPVDAVLLENLQGVQRIWRSWYAGLGPVRINAPAATSHAVSAGTQTVASFSGGVDSFFTLLRRHHEITHLMSIAGFNTPMDDFGSMREHLAPIAARFAKQHVPVLTNIRYGGQGPTPYSIADLMIGYAHGCLLAAITHMMEEHFATYIIPASHQYAHLMPYGSHPLTDPLFSSAKLRVVHDGAAFDRVERTAAVTHSSHALSVLHVCWQDFRRGNCSECQKCLRTMATLDLLGARERAVSFDWSAYSLERLGSTWLPADSDRAFFGEIADAARARGRMDLVKAIETAIARSRRRARQLEALGVARKAFDRVIKSNALTRRFWTATRPIRAGLRNVWSG